VRRRWPVLLVLLRVVLWVAMLLVAVLLQRQRHVLLLAADADELLSPMRAARRDADCFGAVMVMRDLRAFVRAALRDRDVDVAAAAGDCAEHRA
jgi:hypothetical protein